MGRARKRLAERFTDIGESVQPGGNARSGAEIGMVAGRFDTSAVSDLSPPWRNTGRSYPPPNRSA
jgi:hypothetical protein